MSNTDHDMLEALDEIDVGAAFPSPSLPGPASASQPLSHHQVQSLIQEGLQLTENRIADNVAQQISSAISAFSTGANTSSPGPTPPQEPHSVASAAPLGLVPSTRTPLMWPAHFDGSKEKWTAFKEELMQKITLDKDLFGSNAFVWTHIYQCLSEDVKLWVSAFWMSGGPNNERNPEHLIKYLEAQFGDHNERGKAADHLKQLKQEDGVPFTNFVCEFERYLQLAEGTSWSSSQKLAWLKDATHKSLKLAVAAVKMPEDYHDWIYEMTRVANEVESCQVSRPNPFLPTPASAPPRFRRDHEGDTPMSGVNAASTGPPPNAPRAEWASAEEMNRRRSEDLCLRCGSSEHFIAGCNLRGPKRNTGKTAAGQQKSRLGLKAGAFKNVRFSENA